MKSGIFNEQAMSPRKVPSTFESPRAPKRHSLRMALIPTINQAVTLQREALRILKYRSIATDAEADRLLTDALHLLNQCAEPDRPALVQICHSIADIRHEFGLDPVGYRKAMHSTTGNELKPNRTSLSPLRVAPPGTTGTRPNPSPLMPMSPISSETVTIANNGEDGHETLVCEYRRNNGTKNPTKWHNLIGLVDAKSRLREIMSLKGVFSHLLVTQKDTHAGALMFGPPGTGKTSLVSAAADYFGWNAMFVSAGDILSKYCGDSEQKVRQIFKQSIELSPCILFVDEIDSLAQARSAETSAISRRILTELMIQLSRLSDDEFKEKKVVFIAATNEPWSLDAALLRRVPYKIYTPYLTMNEIRQLIQLQLPHMLKDCDLAAIVL